MFVCHFWGISTFTYKFEFCTNLDFIVHSHNLLDPSQWKVGGLPVILRGETSTVLAFNDTVHTIPTINMCTYVT